MTGREVKAVLLDALGTLVRLEPPAPRLRDQLRRRAGVELDEETAARGFEAEISYYLAHHLDGGDPGRLEDLRARCALEMTRAIGLEGRLDPSVARRAMLDSLEFTPFPDVPPALRELRARGLRLVVASNWDCSLPRWLERAGLGALLDGAVS
ncbi:MAG: HAD family hydrolase, partial [Thermoleophilaceae bacterium]